MPNWKTHEKWCQALGVRKEVCQKVNRIIDSPPHDIVDKLLKWRWAREWFESGKLKTSLGIVEGDEYQKVTSELANITHRFGEEGIKATFNHIALDRIAELIELGFDKEEIRKKLIKNDLMKYISDYNQVFDDISQQIKPSNNKIKNRKEFEKLAKSGIYGMFSINGKFIPAVAGLIYIKGRIKKGEKLYIKWGIDAYDARRGRIKKFISNERELDDLIKEVKNIKRNFT